MPLGGNAAGLPVTVAVSKTDPPSVPMGGLPAAAMITVAVLEVPWLMVSGSTGLVEPA